MKLLVIKIKLIMQGKVAFIDLTRKAYTGSKDAYSQLLHASSEMVCNLPIIKRSHAHNDKMLQLDKATECRLVSQIFVVGVDDFYSFLEKQHYRTLQYMFHKDSEKRETVYKI